MRKYFIFLIAIILIFNSKVLFSKWEQMNYGMWHFDTEHLVIIDDILIAGTGAGIYRSTNNGASWEISPGSVVPCRYINDLDVVDNKIFLSTGIGLYVSENKGIDWNLFAFDSTDVKIFTYNNGIYYCTTNWPERDILKSTDKGKTWISLKNGILKNQSLRIGDILVTDDSIFLAYEFYGIYYSSDGGENWEIRNNGLTRFDNYFRLLAKLSSCVVLEMNGIGTYISTDNGKNWNIYESGSVNMSFLADKDTLYLSRFNGFYKRVFRNNTLEPISYSNTNLNKDVKKIVKYKNKFYICADSILLSTDNMATMKSLSIAGASNFNVGDIEYDGENLYAIMQTSTYHNYSDFYKFNGYYWERINIPKDLLAPYSYFDFRYIRFLDNNICLFQGNKYSGILISNDKGKNWIKKDINIQETQFNRNIINSVFALNHSLFLLTGDGIFFSSDLSDSWEKRVNGIADTMFVTSKLLLVDDILFVITDSRQLYRSTNEGISWEICIEGLPEMKYVTSIISFKGQIYAYFSKYGLCKSTDSGNSWIKIKDSEYFNSDYYYYPAWDIPQNNSITTFFVHNDSLFYGTVKTGVNYISEDGSKTFNLSDGLIYRGIGNSAVVGDNIYVGTYGGIFRLTSQASTPENNLTIYPNPASDYLYLSNIYPLDKVEIEIYDSSGKLVINKKIASFTEFPIKIDIRGLAISAYYGYITVDGVKYSVNFIKSRH